MTQPQGDSLSSVVNKSREQENQMTDIEMMSDLG